MLQALVRSCGGRENQRNIVGSLWITTRFCYAFVGVFMAVCDTSEYIKKQIRRMHVAAACQINAEGLPDSESEAENQRIAKPPLARLRKQREVCEDHPGQRNADRISRSAASGLPTKHQAPFCCVSSGCGNCFWFNVHCLMSCQRPT